MPEESIVESIPRDESNGSTKEVPNGAIEKELPDVPQQSDPEAKANVEDAEAVDPKDNVNGAAPDVEATQIEQDQKLDEQAEPTPSTPPSQIVHDKSVDLDQLEEKSEAEPQDTASVPDIKVEKSSPLPGAPEDVDEADVTPAVPEIAEPVQEAKSEPASTNNNNNNIPQVAAAPPPAVVKNNNFLIGAFTSLSESKDLKKNQELKGAIQKALDTLNNPTSNTAHIIFDTLKLTCETKSHNLQFKAVDIFAKVFDYGIFEGESDIFQLTDASVDVISACFEGEGTDPLVETQVLRALTNIILLMPCHGASLLKAVRQIYNIFIFSLSSDNQLIAQGTLNQVISSIFGRIVEKQKQLQGRERTDSLASETLTAGTHSRNGSTVGSGSTAAPLTLEKLNDSSNDDERVKAANLASENDEDLVVKDAFLIFRAMCKLSVKPLESDSLDMRSHAVRSKLLSLHIIHTILKDHIEIFLSHDVVILSSSSNESNTRLINAVRQYLCLSLSRNAASPLAPVFELSLEIFWLIISNLRSDFKREIPVFWDEIYLPVAEMKTSTPHQKRYLLSIIEKLCNDSRCIIEFYLNYDCDSTMPNICEKIIDYLSKLSLIRVEVSQQQKLAYREFKKHGISVYDISKTANLASGKMSSKPPEPEIYNHFPLEYSLKMESIECTVGFLKSLFSWAQKQNPSSPSGQLATSLNGSGSHVSLRERSTTVDSTSNNTAVSTPTRTGSFVGIVDPDDPEQFENLKQRKKAFLDGVKQFNQKPKKGIKYFLEQGFIKDDDPRTIAIFLLETDTLDKASLGEYLGEGDKVNIAIMHAFVDEMDFINISFVDALRKFLQSFRLPGEGQKIDRFMLKFAERYVLGNPSKFTNADAAYILAYSTIMLNTDQHSPQVKNRMTIDNFVMNNAGIDDGKDLPREFLQGVFDEIQNNEIKLQSEQHSALLSVDANTSGGGFFGGRDLNREAYIHASREMSTKTEKLVRNLGKKGSKLPNGSLNNSSLGLNVVDDSSTFYVASHVYHVKSIFDTLWMSILAGLTPPFKEYDDKDTCQLCLEGIKLSIRIACMFELDYARTSFIGALVQFENLNNYEEMKPKNVDAIYIMLELATLEGDHLQSSWIQILTSISQLERLQLIAQGVDQYSIPDVSVAKMTNRGSSDTNGGSNSRNSTSFFSSFTGSTPTASQTASNKFHNQHLTPEVAKLLTTTELEVDMDKVFTNSAKLSRESIVEFVKALSQVSSEEIESSGLSSNPRMFSLQKFVDVCYYNMGRIRLEWSQLWSIMGETFNEVGCHTSNSVIAFFALDSLRQLSMRFFEIEELSHFKFQKEFLKPFEYIMIHNESLEVKDMVLECINNMVLAKADLIKSGWKTIFGVLTASAVENKESLVNKSFKMANWINKEFVEVVRQQESFGDLVKCFTELAKNDRFQKISLLSLEVLSKLMNNEGKKYISAGSKGVPEEVLNKVWFPILFAFHDIIMTGEELEVRSRALNHLFKILMEYGEHFELDFWKEICYKLLFPIFSILSTHWELGNVDGDNDKLSVWLSTTLIQALRNMISLLTHYFESLSPMLPDYLKLLISCICQENDTIARIGRSCLHSLLIDNCSKFNDEQWSQITEAFANLFELTTAKELFTSDPLRANQNEDEQDDSIDADSSTLSQGSFNLSTTEVRLKKSKEKSSIVVKCVLQLLMIETLSELFENDNFYESVPYTHLIKMSKLLEDSYNFSRTFNDDYDLRVRLWNAGVIERLPNLLKQESSSSAVFINIMFRMYCDDDKTTTEEKSVIINTIIPLCNSITARFADFDEANQQRNITTWKPVIVEIFQGYVELDDADFLRFTPEMYSLSLKLIGKNSTTDLRLAIKTFLARVGDEFISKK